MPFIASIIISIQIILSFKKLDTNVSFPIQFYLLRPSTGKMNNLLIFLCILSLSFHQGITLRCRNNRQLNDNHFQKIFQTCKNRNLGINTDSNESDSSESSSNEDIFNKKLFPSTTNGRSGRISSRNEQSYDRNRYNNNKSTLYSTTASSLNFNYGRGNSRTMQQNRGRNYNNEQGKSCIVQCFFNELNVMDQRGYPDRRSVTELFAQNIRDPELQDFVEESIRECFHYLNSNMRKEKCEYSQNLLTCLADKGKERCDDWDD